MMELDFETLVPGHGSVLKGEAFVQQEAGLIEAVVEAMNKEIARVSADPKTRFDEIRSAVEHSVDVSAGPDCSKRPMPRCRRGHPLAARANFS